MKKSGLFITFEGIDGSGKTTQCQRLVTALKGANISYVATREPGGTPLGDCVRDILINSNDLSLDPKAEVFLFLANRVQNVAELVMPALAEGKIVISDRHRDSTIAFQGGGRQLGLDWLDQLHRDHLPIEPDCTLLFDLPVEASLARSHRRDTDPAQAKHRDRFELEAAAFHERIRAAYLELAKRYPERFVIVDAAPEIDDVTEAMFAALAERYPNQFGFLK
jgi:dTMP kinase